jgi:23S rRNA (adenine2503-C2)-methyltransferase
MSTEATPYTEWTSEDGSVNTMSDITRVIQVPTGHILIIKGTHGQLECLSLGDYGKGVNLKCDAMGLTREPEKVRHQAMLPLSDKWVITISTQYGCSMGCKFCDVPKVGSGRNATLVDLSSQIAAAMSIHPGIRYGKRLNIHYARMGEPTWNPAVIAHAATLRRAIGFGFDTVHPVVSTMMPRRNKDLPWFLSQWMQLKNENFAGEAGLQLSINSTDDGEREAMFNGNAMSLADISAMMLDGMTVCGVPRGRKITLNFAVAGYTVDAERLAELFSPAYFICKLTPMHKTESAMAAGIHTDGDYTTYHPYRELEEKLKAAGYDVLVFIASHEEDAGRITCGNAILSGSEVEL